MSWTYTLEQKMLCARRIFWIERRKVCWGEGLWCKNALANESEWQGMTGKVILKCIFGKRLWGEEVDGARWGLWAMLFLVQDLWLSISIISTTLRFFKTKVMCTIFISVDIFSLKYCPNNKNSFNCCFTVHFDKFKAFFANKFTLY
jgi:hypothetical protein